MRFSAVLLAGGKSTRMGCDKALLEIEGEPLWQRQLAKLRRLKPEQLMLSGPKRDSTPLFRAERSGAEESRGAASKIAPRDPPSRLAMTTCTHEIIPDEIENAGPLGGIAAALRHCTAPLLAVLAVDLPRMTTEFLQKLLALSNEGRGAISRGSDFFEPLAAVYPVTCAKLAAKHLRRGDFSMQNFVRAAIENDFLATRVILPNEQALFANLNTSADL